MIQRSLVLLKPDAVQRGIAGEILARFERAGLKIVGAKLINVDKNVVKKHYKKDAEWHKMIGGYSLRDCEKYGISAMEHFGTENAEEIGKEINSWLYDMMSMGPVFAFVLKGPGAVSKIRKLVGNTYPDEAEPGTIRGDFGLDSVFSSMKRKRSVLNLIHASGTPEEAEDEIKMWFTNEELVDYKRSHEDIYSY
jgi:nucleoside-diphosphate kinase